MSLAGQYLVLQLAHRTRRADRRRRVVRWPSQPSLSSASRDAAPSPPPSPWRRTRPSASLLPCAEPRLGAALPAVAESVRSCPASATSPWPRPDRTVARHLRTRPRSARPAADSETSAVMAGRSWTGAAGRVRPAVPRRACAGIRRRRRHGRHCRRRARTTLRSLERPGRRGPNLLTYLGVARSWASAGSLLLARRVKRQTLGMEPDEITGLVEHREAMLHGAQGRRGRPGPPAADHAGQRQRAPAA